MSAPANACFWQVPNLHIVYHGQTTASAYCVDGAGNESTVSVPSTSDFQVTPNVVTGVTATTKLATFTITHIGSGFGDITLSGTYSGPFWTPGENDFSPELQITVDPPNPSGNSTANHPASGTMPKDPVNSYTGELYTAYAPDLNLGGPMPLYFSRYYGAMIDQDGNISSALGTNWLHNFDMTMIQTTGAETVATIVTNRGRVINFQQNGADWDLLGSPDIPYQLVDGGGGNFVFGDPRHERQYTFNASGQLIQIADGRGNTQTLSYSSGNLSTVTDGLGRTLTFSYSSGNLASVSDNGSPSRTVTFGQSSGNLTAVTDARGNTTTWTSTHLLY